MEGKTQQTVSPQVEKAWMPYYANSSSVGTGQTSAMTRHPLGRFMGWSKTMDWPWTVPLSFMALPPCWVGRARASLDSHFRGLAPGLSLLGSTMACWSRWTRFSAPRAVAARFLWISECPRCLL